MSRILISALFLFTSFTAFSQINFKGYVIGNALPENKINTTKMSFAGHYGHFEANQNSQGVIHSISFKPEKSGTPTLMTKAEVQKFIVSLKHYFRVEMTREGQGKNGLFKGVHKDCHFTVDYIHQQFNYGSFYHINLTIHNPKFGTASYVE
ncbi:hypothetical protein [Flammeovirga sp. SJP92]|uniref:hypothetical protein n=1 Tax=Flammeovirga sp. SJP92 TaxID=1775430 RepID=UPI000787C84B|nr:hypothetical protein [Flammeovirga sp. SJP92]KXX66760.1 hypothetical protein AVL50_29960 [Flammeovirga sp. SJP92]